MQGLTPDNGVGEAIPRGYSSYCKVGLPESWPGAQRRHDRAVVSLLAAEAEAQPWWLGYLDVGLGADVVFSDAPRVRLYHGWDYVLVQAGPEQAVDWRPSEGVGSPWKGALPDLIFPADRSFLFSTLWDDHWSSVGGSHKLIGTFLRDPELGSRTTAVAPGED